MPPRASSSPASASPACGPRLLRRRRASSPTCSPVTCPPTAWSPASAASSRPPRGDHGQRQHRQGRKLGQAHRREDHPHPRRPQKRRCPMLYLVDSAGARITDQVEMFPGRRGAGRIFYNQVADERVVPQICLLFGPSGRRRRLHPRVLRRRGHGGQERQHVPRQPAHGRDGHRREGHPRGDGRRPHALRAVSGCGDVLVKTRPRPGVVPQPTSPTSRSNCSHRRPPAESAEPARRPGLDEIVPAAQEQTLRHQDRHRRPRRSGLVPRDQEALCQRAHHRPRPHRGPPGGHLANHPRQKGGVLFVDSADKAARFINLCDAFNIPLLYLADVPGFMIGSKVEREGIIRHGAKMISAGQRRHRASHQRHRAQGLRRRPLRHVRPGLRARLHPRVAPGHDRRDGSRSRRQRRVCQQDRPARSGASGLRPEAARRVRRGRRPHQARLRAGRRRRRARPQPARSSSIRFASPTTAEHYPPPARRKHGVVPV
jgi:hypothetical protein